MNAIDVIYNITNNENLLDAHLKYCLVDENKVPYRYDDVVAKPNNVDDFKDIDTILLNDNLDGYKGVGLSIQANKICAIDIDGCVQNKFDVNSINELALDIINLFKNDCYVEFSFSGSGIRILFKADIIDNYNNVYYIKNSKKGIEYYQPSNSFRYVTVTGRFIYNNKIKKIDNKLLNQFLDKYMKRDVVIKPNLSKIKDESDIKILYNKVRYHILKNYNFQENWFNNAPGSGKNESERDYYLVAYLYDHITKDPDKIKQLFEMSPFFKSKDSHHVYKWNKNKNEYYNAIYNKIRGLDNE